MLSKDCDPGKDRPRCRNTAWPAYRESRYFWRLEHNIRRNRLRYRRWRSDGRRQSWRLLPGCRRGAIRTQDPVEIQGLPAGVAQPAQLRAAVGTDQPLGLSDRLALRAGSPLRDVSQQRFFLQLAIIYLGQSLLRPQEQIQDDTHRTQHECQQSGKDPGKDITRAKTNVANHPDHQGDPHGDGEGHHSRNDQLQGHTDLIQ